MRPLLCAAALAAYDHGQVTLDEATEEAQQALAIGGGQQRPAGQQSRVRGRVGPLDPLAHGSAGTPVEVRDEQAALAAVKMDMAHHLPGSPDPKLLAVSSRHGGD